MVAIHTLAEMTTLKTRGLWPTAEIHAALFFCVLICCTLPWVKSYTTIHNRILHTEFPIHGRYAYLDLRVTTHEPV